MRQLVVTTTPAIALRHTHLRARYSINKKSLGTKAVELVAMNTFLPSVTSFASFLALKLFHMFLRNPVRPGEGDHPPMVGWGALHSRLFVCSCTAAWVGLSLKTSPLLPSSRNGVCGSQGGVASTLILCALHGVQVCKCDQDFLPGPGVWPAVTGCVPALSHIFHHPAVPGAHVAPARHAVLLLLTDVPPCGLPEYQYRASFLLFELQFPAMFDSVATRAMDLMTAAGAMYILLTIAVSSVTEDAWPVVFSFLALFLWGLKTCMCLCWQLVWLVCMALLRWVGACAGLPVYYIEKLAWQISGKQVDLVMKKRAEQRASGGNKHKLSEEDMLQYVTWWCDIRLAL